MKINRSNYEIYFLDYLDGNLPDDQVDDFLDFLKNNPDLHEELKAVSEVKLSPDETVFQQKEILLKDSMSGVSDFDYRAVAYLEGDLESDDEKAFLDSIRKDKSLEKQFDLFLKTKFQPDNQIICPQKEELYRKSGVKLLFSWTGRVAAGLVLLIGLWAIWNYQSAPEKVQPQVASEQVTQFDVSTEPGAVTKTGTNHDRLANNQRSQHLENLTPKSPTILLSSTFEKTGMIAVEQRVQRESAPSRLAPLTPRVAVSSAEIPGAFMAMRKSTGNDQNKYLTLNELLAQKVLHQKQGESLSVSGVLTAGLEAVSDVSNDRLKYETNQKGKVSEISLNTRILAFSIPLRKRQ